MLCTLSEHADKDLGRLSPEIKQRIVDKLKYLCENELLLVNSKPLSGDFGGFFRIRVGDYRVIFDIKNNNQAFVTRIGHRKEIYN
jgi:mRNA interferase RelE/StbE